MRTSLFVPALFAVSLIGSAALADKPHGAVDRVRAHGDVVDKSYRSAAQRPAAGAPQQVNAPARYQFNGGTSRVSCSDVAADCPTRRAAARSPAAAHASAGEDHAAAASVGGRAVRAPAVLDKALGSERTSFNEAGEDTGMSKRAANRLWAHAGDRSAAAGALTPAAAKQASRADNQSAETRVACNEGDQCMASSKATKKQWAYEAVKAGTWKGPEEKKETGAARSIREMKASKGSEGAPPNAAHHERQKHDHEQHN
jgi:hypothetical protein